MIIHIPLDRITPNPWQTRQGDPDLDYIKELALDIANNGLLQNPVGRLAKDVDLTYSTGSLILQKLTEEDLTIQLAFGHNRLAAYRWIQDVQPSTNIPGDWTAMPVDLRPLTDEQMANMAWSENEKRRDHTPIERALAIQKRMADFGWTQQQIAEHLGISRPAVSNALRLLKLPENITAALASGKISERVALALAGYFDLPESIKRDAGSGWYKASDLVREALEGKLTSDGVREKINDFCLWYGKDLAKAPFALDDPFMIPDVISPFCRDCDQRYAQRNLCLNKDCYQLKLHSHRLAVLQRAADDCGIPPHDNQDAQSYEYTEFLYGVLDGALETVVAGKCPNLRLRYSQGVSQIPKHPDAEIVCSKREQYCSCLAGLRAAQPKVEHHYNYETHQSEKIVSAPLVTIETDQPTVEDLKAVAQAARRAQKQVEQDQQAAIQEAAERIAVGLTHGSLPAWKWLARETNYGLEKTVAPMDNAFDVRATIAASHIAGFTYPDTLAKTINLLNNVLSQCGLELLDLPGSEAQPDPAGKTLAEVFSE